MQLFSVESKLRISFYNEVILCLTFKMGLGDQIRTLELTYFFTAKIEFGSEKLEITVNKRKMTADSAKHKLGNTLWTKSGLGNRFRPLPFIFRTISLIMNSIYPIYKITYLCHGCIPANEQHMPGNQPTAKTKINMYNVTWLWIFFSFLIAQNRINHA